MLRRFLPESHYVSEEGLKNLKLYKYQSVDKSYLTHYVLRHYWNWVVEFFPLWMAPNLITLIGLIIGIIFHLLLVTIYIPDLEQEAPAWLYISCAAGMWLYSTFDNIDGKQARRTGTSSPLGELFDHGCDALNTSLGAIIQIGCLGLGHNPLAMLILSSTTVPFYFSTWEEYHTGVLYLGYINGPTEGLVASCITMALSGILGVRFWQQKLWTLIPSISTSLLSSVVPHEARVIDFLAILLLLGVFVFHIPFSLASVYEATKKKNTSFLVALFQLSPIFIFEGAKYAWVFSPYSSIMSKHYFILFTLTTGVVFGRIATKIILSHVTKMPFPMFTVLQVPLLAGAVLVNAPYFGYAPIFTPSTELLYLRVYLAFAAVAYFHWALLVIDKFCTFLGISCLTIRKQEGEEEAKKDK